MALATTRGRKYALLALAERRKANKDRQPVDNASLYAGSSMHYDCTACNADIQVPETEPHRPLLCDECGALKKLNWLE